jgi:hypothetical protein
MWIMGAIVILGGLGIPVSWTCSTPEAGTVHSEFSVTLISLSR